MRLKWLHISDIHYHINNYESIMLRKDLLTRITGSKDLEPFTHVFCTGDVTDKNGVISGDLLQYMQDIATAAGVIKDNFVIVPGNHDHNRKSISDILTGIYDYDDTTFLKDSKDKRYIDNNIKNLSSTHIQKLLESFFTFNQFYQEFKGNPYYSNYINPHIVDIKQYDDYNILRINTSWLDRDSNNAELRCGINKLVEALEKSCLKKDCINLAVGHHPLHCFEINECNRIKDILYRNNMGIYLCGHVHKPFINYDLQYDILEIGCSTGKSDDYCPGGYTIGTMDTNLNCYKIEMFRWKNGSWYTEIDIPNADENGKFYFNTKKYKHYTDKIAVAFKVYGNKLSLNEITETFGDDKYELIQYPYTNIDIQYIEWEKQKNHVIEFAKQILALSDKNIFVYPIAPIPMLIQLGYELQNNSEIKIFQYDRECHKWVYDAEDNICSISVNSIIKNASKLALIIATSTPVLDEQVNTHIDKRFDIYRFDSSTKKVGCPLYHNQYIRIIDEVFKSLDAIANKYKEIHVFASIPAGMAIEFGRRLQKGIYPTIILYNYYHGYSKSITINEAKRRKPKLINRLRYLFRH